MHNAVLSETEIRAVVTGVFAFMRLIAGACQQGQVAAAFFAAPAAAVPSGW